MDFFEFIPLILFFTVYKLYNLYAATLALIVCEGLRILIYKYQHRTIDTLQWVKLALIILFGGATVWLHDERFIKWKFTLVYWLVALVFMFYPYFHPQTTFLQYLLEGKQVLSHKQAKVVNICFMVFLFGMGTLNLAIAHYFSTEVWMHFKIFGSLIITFLFMVGISIYLSVMEEK